MDDINIYCLFVCLFVFILVRRLARDTWYHFGLSYLIHNIMDERDMYLNYNIQYADFHMWKGLN